MGSETGLAESVSRPYRLRHYAILGFLIKFAE